MDIPGNEQATSVEALGRRAVGVADRGLAGVVAGERWVRVLAGGARYGAAAVLSVVVYPVLAAVVYVALLAWALVTDQPTGGPFGLPVLVLVGALVGVVCTVLAVATCAAAELVTLRLRVPRFALVVGSLAANAALTAVLALLVLGRTNGWTVPTVVTVLGGLAVATPAGVVVVTAAHSGGALTGLVLRAARRRVERRADGAHPLAGTADAAR